MTPIVNFDMPEEKAALVLHLLPGLTQSAATELYRRKGSALAALTDLSCLPEKVAEALRDVPGMRSALERAEAEYEFCQNRRIEILPMNAPHYPTRLAECKDAPLVLFHRGTADLNTPHSLAVVGTRRITEYGKRLCKELCADLKRLMPDTLVVSGLAYGVDVHAHRAALKEGLYTAAVLAHGLDRIYPSLHRETAAEMVEHGGLLTEYLAGAVPDKGNFVRRNRIVAGMTAGTIVVESADRGGALITARLAFDYSREVMAFPGRITDPYSAGCNKLIRSCTAQLVTCGQDILDCLMWEVPTNREKANEKSLFPEWTKDEERIINALDRNDPCSISDLIARTGIPVSVLSATLMAMEMKDWVKRANGNSYLLNF